MTRFTTWLLALALSMPIISGCVVRAAVPVGPPPPEPVYYPPQPAPAPEVYVDEQPMFVPGAPPPPQQEFIPMAPGPNYYWVRGYWNWDNYQWQWVPGYWEWAAPGQLYMEPRYVIINGRWQYQRGYWHDHEGRREYVRPYERRAPREEWRRQGQPAPLHGNMAPGRPMGPGPGSFASALRRS